MSERALITALVVGGLLLAWGSYTIGRIDQAHWDDVACECPMGCAEGARP